VPFMLYNFFYCVRISLDGTALDGRFGLILSDCSATHNKRKKTSILRHFGCCALLSKLRRFQAQAFLKGQSIPSKPPGYTKRRRTV